MLRHICSAALGTLFAVNLLTTAPAAEAAVACAQASALKEVTFKVKRDPPDVDDSFSPYIHLESPENSLANLQDADEIVLPCPQIVVVVDYPLERDAEFPLKAASSTGFTRKELARDISEIYQRIYSEEAATTAEPIIPQEKRVGIANRNQTNGKYGVWGHDLGDLDLSSVDPEVRNGVVYVTLGVDS